MKRDFNQLAGQTYDLLVCGGGIYGAWTAYDAALRGLKVALIEQGDWASGTSSASSKLIHGGLRYLETYDFKLVKKALAERERLLKIAPHRVWPLRFGVPVYDDSRVGALQLKAGLNLYDLMAGTLFSATGHRHFGRDQFSQHFPLLNTTHLRSGYTYTDAQTDDARLVLELVAGAQQAGAVCVNYCKLVEWVHDRQGHVCGAQVQDANSGQRASLQAKQVVNTIGQWATADAERQSWCRLSKGVHLVLPDCGINEAILLTAKRDGRVFFIIPWYGRTVLGTTDTDYHGDLDQVHSNQEDIHYLLDAANDYLKTAWTPADVIGSYAGVRVMKSSDADHPSSASRDWELRSTADGMLHSIGGKITSAREDAEVLVDRVCQQLGRPRASTAGQRRLPWAPAHHDAWLAQSLQRAMQLGLNAETALWLARRHGEHTHDLLAQIEHNPALARRIVPDVPLIHADLLWCAQHEMVVHLDDLLRRRLPLLILARMNRDLLHTLAASIAPTLGWDDTTQAREVERCLA